MKDVTEADREIGRRIKEARLERQISAKTLGIAVNVTFQQIQKYEMGINRIAASRLVDVARFLEVPVATLLGETETPTPLLACSPQAHALAVTFDRLPHADLKKRLHAMVVALADTYPAGSG